jgi:hypothetical protein
LFKLSIHHRGIQYIYDEDDLLEGCDYGGDSYNNHHCHYDTTITGTTTGGGPSKNGVC